MNDMSTSLSRLLALVSKTHRSAAERLLSRVGVHAGQEFILLALWEADGRTQAELARELRVSPPTINRMVTRMANAGFVERRACANDHRVARIYLADKGREVRPAVEAQWQTLETATMEGIAPNDREILRVMLEQILHNMSSDSTR